ncbi:ABC transporter permease [Aliidongia dinghuensis]|uniref:ABC transporter permease n=1 Tax=Aliidongia dinghuensis TaxID=1867774 RepID=A0A8J3E2G5_9PROT|nr:ABC transporter permease [Aliidongia dinghuensis]GGF20949.1 ABC transporter permease [Aliidongia dinghuensis]
MSARRLAQTSTWVAWCARTVMGFLVIPTLIIVPLSFNGDQYLHFPPRNLSLRWYQNFWASPDWLDAARMSFVIAIAVTILAVPLGTAAALALSRLRFRGKSLVFGLMLSPLMVPVVVLALALYFYFSTLHLVGSWAAIVLGQTILAFPFVLVNVHASLQGYPVTLERAARTLGAGPLTIFFRVTLPIIRPGVMAGALFAFMVSFDEIVIALFLASPGATTMPVKMWLSMQFSINPTIAAVSTMVTGLSVALFLAMAWARRRTTRRRTAPVT